MQRLVDRHTVRTFWAKESEAMLLKKRVELERERDSYPADTPHRRDVEWYLDILEEVLASKRPPS